MIVDENLINVLSKLNTLNFDNFYKVIDVNDKKITITFEMQSGVDNIKDDISVNIRTSSKLKNNSLNNFEFRETWFNSQLKQSNFYNKKSKLKKFCLEVGAKFDNLDYAPIEPMKFGSSGIYEPKFINYKSCPIKHWAIDVYTKADNSDFKTYRFLTEEEAKKYHSIVAVL